MSACVADVIAALFVDERPGGAYVDLEGVEVLRSLGVRASDPRGGGVTIDARGVYNMCMTYDQIRQLAADAALETEHVHLERELAASGWVLVRAAERLQCAPTTLRRALDRFPDLSARMADGRTGNPGRPRKQEKKKNALGESFS